MSLDYSNEAAAAPLNSNATALQKIEATRKKAEERERRRIESFARPGETYQQAKDRWNLENDVPTKQIDARSTKHRPSMRKAPKGDEQGDFLVPAMYDIGTRDCRSVMDVLIVRLSKTQKRANTRIEYDLPDGYVSVTSGVDGMASIWDYDIILMAISHLTESLNRYKEGKGNKPGRRFRPHAAEVLKFTRRSTGGNQKESLEMACKRLNTTHVEVKRQKPNKEGQVELVTEGEHLISSYKVIRNLTKNTIEFLEIEIAQWMYDEITSGKNPDVLTVHPDYFLIDEGIGRFIYRLARRAAGNSMADWSFRLLYERSASTVEFKKFSHSLRQIIKANDLPEYSLEEREGRNGPILIMRNRNFEGGSPTVENKNTGNEGQ